MYLCQVSLCLSQEHFHTFQNGGAKWVLYNLAGLYWRIIGNNYHAIECFRRAIYTAPDDVQDVPEINLANVLYRWGRFEDAKTLIRESMKLNKYEVSLYVVEVGDFYIFHLIIIFSIDYMNSKFYVWITYIDQSVEITLQIFWRL